MHRRLSVLCLATVIVAAVAGIPAAHAGALPPGTAPGYPGEVVVPAAYDTTPAQVLVRSGYDDDGYDYSVGTPAHEVVVYKGTSLTIPDGEGAVLAGSSLYLAVAASGDTSWTATNLDTGTTNVVGTFATQSTTTALHLITEAPSGWITSEADPASGLLHIDLNTPGQSPRVLHIFPADAFEVLGGTADDSGALIQWEQSGATLETNTYHLGYVSYGVAGGGATWTGLSSSGGAPFALAPHVLAYIDTSGDLIRVDRSDLSVLSTRPGFGGLGLSISDTASAMDQPGDPGGLPDRVTTCAEPAGPCGTLSLGKPDVSGFGAAIGVAAVGDSFVAGFGDTAATRALRSFAPGATSPGPVVALLGGGPPLSVSLAAGKLAVEQPTLTYEQRADSTRGRAVLGSSEVDDAAQAGTPEFQTASSGERTAFVRCTSQHSCAKSETVVSDAGVVTAILPGGDATPSLAGDKVLVPGVAKSELYTVDAGVVGKPTAEPPFAAMDANRIVWATPDHAVMLRDLATPHARDVTLRPPAANPGCELEVQAPEVSADWVLWDFDCENDLFTHDAHATAVHLTSADRIDKTVTVAVTQRDLEAHLTDGAVALIAVDPSDPSGAHQGPAPVHVINLNTGADIIVGQAHALVGNRSYLAASDELVAWVGDDDLVHVIPNPVKADAGPTLLGSTTMVAPAAAASAHLVLAGQARKPVIPYRVEVDASRPVSRYVATLRDSRGHPVTTQRGSAPTGGVVLVWKGTVGRHVAAPGRYTWTLVASGPGGPLTSRGKQVRPRVVVTVRPSKT